jgi:hypothetical protein
MKRFLFALASTLTLISGVAVAQSNYDSNGNVSSTNAPSTSTGMLKDEVVGFIPEVGVLAFTDPATGTTTSRGGAGLGVDWNISPMLGEAFKPFYLGISTGFIYSHLGSSTSNFFGTNPNVAVTDPGSNLLLIPADLKLGWSGGSNARISIHGGGNVIYRTVASAIDFGSSSFQGGSVWSIFPNAGADFEVGIGRNVSLNLRPDFTFTPGNTLFTGTLGLGLNLG